MLTIQLLTSLINRPIHAPLKTKTIRAKPINKWYTPALSVLKTARRHLEYLCLRTHSPHHLKLVLTASNKYHSAIIAAKKRFNASLIASSSSSADSLARCRLRSASSSILVVVRTRLTTVGDRSFPVAASHVWNNLPQHVITSPFLRVLKNRLKTHLFSSSFP